MFSLPSLGLPTNVQNRLLSFLLRRLLGHLVVGGQIELDRIDADLTRGKLVLGHVDLEAEVRTDSCSLDIDPLFFTSCIASVSVGVHPGRTAIQSRLGIYRSTRAHTFSYSSRCRRIRCPSRPLTSLHAAVSVA
jgi:hypothetical protein